MDIGNIATQIFLLIYNALLKDVRLEIQSIALAMVAIASIMGLLLINVMIVRLRMKQIMYVVTRSIALQHQDAFLPLVQPIMTRVRLAKAGINIV